MKGSSAKKGRERGLAGVLRRAMLFLSFAVLLLCPFAASASPPADRAPEHALKAAFLYNFAKFVTWPAEPSSPENAAFCIGVVGEDPTFEALEELVEGKTIDGRPIRVERFKGLHSLDPCHILFIPEGTSSSTKETIRSASAPGVLTVGEADDFARLGGVIRLFMEEKKMRFEINPAAAEEAGLYISSKMLALARLVEGGGRQEERP